MTLCPAAAWQGPVRVGQRVAIPNSKTGRWARLHPERGRCAPAGRSRSGGPVLRLEQA